MIIRPPEVEDKPEIDRIYKKYFSANEYPDFINDGHFMCSFVVCNDDKIVLAGGVKTIAEAVVVSDQSLPTRVRFDALLQALGSVALIAKEMNYSQVHVFVNNDEKYVKGLQKFGFKLIDAKLLILDLGDSHG